MDDDRRASMKSRLVLLITAVLILAGCMLTIVGFNKTGFVESLPFSRNGGLKLVIYLLACVVSLAAAHRLWRLPVAITFLAIAMFVALFAGDGWSLLVVGWFGFSALLLGRIVVQFVSASANDHALETILPMIVGAGLLGTVVGIMAIFPVNYPSTYAALLTLPVIICWRQAKQLLRDATAALSYRHPAEARVDWLQVALYAVFLIHVVIAFVPENGHDALAMHLFIPAHLALRHQWGFDVSTYVWAVMPLLGDWIFAIGYMLGGETSARLINVGFIGVLAVLIQKIVLWARGNARGAHWASLIFLSMPLTFTESSSLFIESIWATFIVAGTWLICRVCATEKFSGPQDLAIAGLMLGLAAACKAVTFVFLPILLLVLLICAPQWARREYAQKIMIGLLFFLLLATIPYAYAYWKTGNPLFPYYNQIFQSSLFTIENFSDPRWGKGLTWAWPYDLTFAKARYIEGDGIGVAGFQWLILFIPAVLFLVTTGYRRACLLLTIGLASVVLVTQFIAYLRYIFPAMVVLIAGMGVAFSHFENRGTKTRTLFFGLLSMVVALNLLFLNSAAQYREMPLETLISQTDRAKYVRNIVPIRAAVEMVNQLNVGVMPVAVFGEPMAAGLIANALYPNWYNRAFEKEVKGAASPEAMVSVLQKRRVEFIVVESGWENSELRERVEKATDLVARIGPISIRVPPDSGRFTEELLVSPQFSAGKGWRLEPGAKLAQNGSVIVTAKGPAHQTVSVQAGMYYRNSVVASCVDQPTMGRIQINWVDAKHKYLSTSSINFQCATNPTEYVMKVFAPARAAYAVVYTSSHLDVPVAFFENSLKR